MDLSDRDIARFWAKVEKGEGCWLWTGVTHRRGLPYGRLQTKKFRDGKWKTVWFPAHRVSFYLAHGEIDPALYVLHACDNPTCVNPAHLSQGSAKDNTDDMVQKNRARKARGEQAGNARLTTSMVLDIRSRYAAGGITQQALADEYELSFQHVSDLIRRKRWTHV